MYNIQVHYYYYIYIYHYLLKKTKQNTILVFCISNVMHVHQSSQSIKLGHRKRRTIKLNITTTCVALSAIKPGITPRIWALRFLHLKYAPGYYKKTKNKEKEHRKKRKAGKKRSLHSPSRSNKQHTHTHTHGTYNFHKRKKLHTEMLLNKFQLFQYY